MDDYKKHSMKALKEMIKIYKKDMYLPPYSKMKKAELINMLSQIFVIRNKHFERLNNKQTTTTTTPPIPAKKVKKRIAPTLISPLPAPVVQAPVPAKKIKKRIAPTLISPLPQAPVPPPVPAKKIKKRIAPTLVSALPQAPVSAPVPSKKPNIRKILTQVKPPSAINRSTGLSAGLDSYVDTIARIENAAVAQQNHNKINQFANRVRGK